MSTTVAAGKPEAEEAISQTTVLQQGQQPQVPLTVASLYVGDLDPVVTEENLVDAFKVHGTILSVRVCRDIITRRSLGYGYVNFQHHADAENALRALNYTVLGSRPIRLMWQQRDPSQRYSGNGNVFVKGLPEQMDNKTLHEFFQAFGTVLSAKVMTDDKGHSRRYGFVHFKDESSAKKAIEEKNGTKIDPLAQDALHVAMFIRRNARIAALIQNFTNVYIKHVLPTVDKETIERLFARFGGITSALAKHDPKGRTYAFCNFAHHQDAVKAIESLHDTQIDGLTQPGEKLFVQRAQQRSERLIELRQKHMQRQAQGNNLYVRNFDPDFTSANLLELFKGYGDIQSARVMRDEKGNARGFGFVCFATADQANTALKELNGRMLNGKPLVVNIAQRRDHRTSMLQVQFQQRIYAMLHQLPFMAPFVAGPPGAGAMMSPFNAQAVAMMQQHVSGPSGARVPRPLTSSTGATAGQRPAAGRGGAGARRQAPAGRAAEGAFPSLPRETMGAAKSKRPAKPAAAAPVAPAEPETPPLAPLTAAELNSMSTEDQKTALGERLYVKVVSITEEHAPKITGMFLEMDPMEALAMLENDAILRVKVDEAMQVLRAHGVNVK